MSGRVGFDTADGIRAKDLEPEVRRMAQGHIDMLSEAGLSLEDIVPGHVYLRDINDYQPFNDIYAEYFTKGPGLRTCLTPNSGFEKTDVRVRASFITARTQPAR